jgi:DNA-binding HxlR family transcriptional regulator
MRRKSFTGMECPVARTLEAIGEWWTMLILRDAFRGVRRFDDFQSRLGIARNILTSRLAGLTGAGILEKRLYSQRPPRYEYRLTPKGRALFPVLVAMMEWGSRWEPPAAGPAVRLVDRSTGQPVEAVLADAATGRPLDPRDLALVPGPGAGPETLAALDVTLPILKAGS